LHKSSTVVVEDTTSPSVIGVHRFSLGRNRLTFYFKIRSTAGRFGHGAIGQELANAADYLTVERIGSDGVGISVHLQVNPADDLPAQAVLLEEWPSDEEIGQEFPDRHGVPGQRL
jgi:hypothetical protein